MSATVKLALAEPNSVYFLDLPKNAEKSVDKLSLLECFVNGLKQPHEQTELQRFIRYALHVCHRRQGMNNKEVGVFCIPKLRLYFPFTKQLTSKSGMFCEGCTTKKSSEGGHVCNGCATWCCTNCHFSSIEHPCGLSCAETLDFEAKLCKNLTSGYFLCNSCYKPAYAATDAMDHCSWCKKARYCSRACQISHWTTIHHRECSQLQRVI